ncbi:MAG: hypothetical protein U5J62_01730 [Desulfurivibrio sp.]|nr:hypothetical protein [Desulfurivibrio sp.]
MASGKIPRTRVSSTGPGGGSWWLLARPSDQTPTTASSSTANSSRVSKERKLSRYRRQPRSLDPLAGSMGSGRGSRRRPPVARL